MAAATPLPFTCYLVGGAVRDRLLERSGVDRDYVVVGATPEAMLAAGFKSVGKDFPVFLHPQSGEEYALARTERKTGHGYHGFSFQATSSVSLEEDLLRRDLTINAMAEDDAGKLIDPHGGLRDLQNRVLRHVSPAFVEDPVRLLRLARFAARFAPMGFRVAEETSVLLCKMVTDGEIDHLVPERVWAETRKALAEAQPSVFFQVLRASGALAVLFPEVDALYGVPQRADYHPEVDTGAHLELVLDMAAQLAPGNDRVGYAALTHDLGKARTPREQWPRHIGHEQRGVAPLRTMSARLRVSAEHAALAEAVCHYHLDAHRACELRPATLLKLLERLDALRRPQRLGEFLLACEADVRGRQGFAEQAYPQADRLRTALAAARAVSSEPLRNQGLQGPTLGAAIRQERIRAIAEIS